MKYGCEEMLNANSQISGWCTEQKAMQLYGLVLDSNAQLIVESGVFKGRSLISFAYACAHKNSGQVVGIDAFDNIAPLEGDNAPENNDWWENVDMEEVFNSVIRNIAKFDLNYFVQIIKAKSEDTACFFEDYSIDIFHQDSNHNETVITKELDLFIQKLKPHGYWIIDDSNWVETKKGYSKLPNYGLKLVEDFESWQIWQKK